MILGLRRCGISNWRESVSGRDRHLRWTQAPIDARNPFRQGAGLWSSAAESPATSRIRNHTPIARIAL